MEATVVEEEAVLEITSTKKTEIVGPMDVINTTIEEEIMVMAVMATEIIGIEVMTAEAEIEITIEVMGAEVTVEKEPSRPEALLSATQETDRTMTMAVDMDQEEAEDNMTNAVEITISEDMIEVPTEKKT
jgi:hypothetical protein